MRKRSNQKNLSQLEMIQQDYKLL
ncbi:hypothetical protein OIU78_012068 [Salix suchowensis]|nr:hypothetical protein OIU78_012068 [Salix suchowensis]